jgi:hypothetical protein
MLKDIFKAFFKKAPLQIGASRSEVPHQAEVTRQQALSQPGPRRKVFEFEVMRHQTASRETSQQAALRYREEMQKQAQLWRDAIASAAHAEDLSQYCSHYSGFAREAAIVWCTRLRRADLLPVVFKRLNDWVPQVRDAARSAVLTLLPLVSHEEALALLPEVHQLEYLKRSDHVAWIEQFECVLVGKIPVAIFVEGLHGASVPLARSCHRILWHFRLIEPAELTRQSLGRLDDILIARMSLQVCASLPEDQQLPLYQTALQSHFGLVRTQALRALLTLGSEESRLAVAIGALWDVQASIRAVAIHHLRTNGADLRTRYLEVFFDSAAPTQRKRIALYELGTVGTLADVELLRSFVTADQPSVRLAALTAWAKLDPSAKDDVARQALADGSPRVRRLAGYLVAEQGAFLPADFIRETMKRHGDGRPLSWLPSPQRM